MKNIYALLLLLSIFFISCGPQNTIQKNAELQSLELAADAKTVMVSYMLNGKYYIWNQQKVQGPYEFLYYPRFSGSKTDPQLLTTFQKQGQWYIRFKGFEYGPYGKDTRPPRVAINALNDISIAFKRDGQEYFLYNDKILGPYAKTGGWVYSPNSQHYAFWYIDDIDFAYEVDGTKFKAGSEYHAPFFLSDNSLGVIRSENKQLYLSIENDELGPFDFALPPVFSKNGKDYAVLYDKKDKSYVYTSKKKWGPYHRILGSPSFSPDESAMSFIFTMNTNKDEYYLHLAGEELGPYQYLMPIQWSDQGPAYAFLFSTADALYLNYSGEISGPYSRLTDIKFLDGQLHLATVSNHEIILQNLD